MKTPLDPFLKVPHKILDSEVLTGTQKCLYMLLLRLKTAKRGCTPSHDYLLRKLKIRSSRTLLRALDRLQFFGYITWKNRGKNISNKYYFRGEPDFEKVLQNNFKRRKIISEKQKILYNQRLRNKSVDKGIIRLVKS